MWCFCHTQTCLLWQVDFENSSCRFCNFLQIIGWKPGNFTCTCKNLKCTKPSFPLLLLAYLTILTVGGCCCCWLNGLCLTITSTGAIGIPVHQVTNEINMVFINLSTTYMINLTKFEQVIQNMAYCIELCLEVQNLFFYFYLIFFKN